MESIAFVGESTLRFQEEALAALPRTVCHSFLDAFVFVHGWFCKKDRWQKFCLSVCLPACLCLFVCLFVFLFVCRQALGSKPL